MTIQITSTTDSPEAVTAAMGDLAEAKPAAGKTPEKPAPVETEEPTETQEDPVKPAATTETETPETEEETETEDDVEVSEEEPELNDQKPKKKGGFQKRIDKLSKRASLAEQEKEYWREQALRAQQKPAGETQMQAAATANPEATAKPKADDFASHEEYVEALTDWKIEERDKTKDQEKRKAAVLTEHQTKIQKHSERVKEFKAAHDDFDEVVSEVATVPLTVAMQEAILTSDSSAELYYELAKDPAELSRIATLTPIEAAKAIGRVEERLIKPTTKTSSEKKTTKAPAPINPVKPRAAASSKTIYDADVSQKEYEELRAQQLKQRRA